jgi:hypothetical protein
MALKPARKGRSEREQGRAATLPEAPETSRRRISTLAILLLLASASIAGLVLGSTPHVVANLGEPAFLVCGVLLALSSVFGLAATLLVAWHEIKGNPASLANATRCLGIQIALLACFVCAIIAFSL